jgi:uncharacterized protein (TIGR02646 family)
MRRIWFDRLQLPDGWEERAQEARRAVQEARQAFEEARARGAEAPQPSCSAVIDANAGVWRDPVLKEALERVSDHKCWYCETKRVRDDFEVDHFRPKSTNGADDHEGYWWLAFDYRNFRFSCRYCNQVRRDRETGQRGGKGSAFPLLEGGIRARGPDDDLLDERCALVDPIEPHDAELIGFTMEGEAVAEADRELEADDCQRAEVSIGLYNLNHSKLRRERGQLATTVANIVAQAQQHFERYRKRRQQQAFPAVNDAKENFKQLRDQLRELKEENQEYSALVIAILKASHCQERPWVSRLFA